MLDGVPLVFYLLGCIRKEDLILALSVRPLNPSIPTSCVQKTLETLPPVTPSTISFCSLDAMSPRFESRFAPVSSPPPPESPYLFRDPPSDLNSYQRALYLHTLKQAKASSALPSQADHGERLGKSQDSQTTSSDEHDGHDSHDEG